MSIEDHVAKAEELLQVPTNVGAAMAQAHATLALVKVLQGIQAKMYEAGGPR